MDLYVKATTNVPDLIIDFIEVKLKSDRTVSLNWEGSNINGFESESKTSFSANYFGLYFNEELAEACLDDLNGLEVVEVGLYSESHSVADIAIAEMTFTDGEQSLTLTNVYSAKGVRADG